MKWTVEPVIVEGCDCEDCKAGRHLYRLYRCGNKDWSAMSLQAYSSAEECKQKHYWGVNIGPDDTWEDGTPIVEPKPLRETHPDGPKFSTSGRVRLDGKIFQKWAETLQKHWRQ
jgi:hypothetical protein